MRRKKNFNKFSSNYFRYVVICFSNPLVYSDFVYSRTNAGQDFKSLCDYVHKFANDIIASRKEALVRLNFFTAGFKGNGNILCRVVFVSL